MAGGLINVVLGVDSLDHEHEAVCGVRRARDKILAVVVLVDVDAHDDNRGGVLGRGGVDDLFGAAVNDGLDSLLGMEDANGLADVVSDKGAPTDLLGVAAAGGLDLLAIGDEEVPLDLDSARGNVVDGVVLTSEANGR